MQLISDRWYRVYNWLLVSISVLLIVGFILSKFAPTFVRTANTLDLVLTTAVIAGISIVYGAAVHFIISKKFNTWLASLIMSMLVNLNIINLLVNTSGPAKYVYVYIWWIIAACSGIFGFATMLLFNFLTVAYVVIETGSHYALLTTPLKLILIGNIVASLITYIFLWHRKFKVNRVEMVKQIDQLAGMPQDTQKQSETLVESIADGVIVINPDGKISLINAAAAAMTEWARQDAIGVDVNLVIKLTQEGGQVITANQNPFLVGLNTKKKVEMSAELTGRQGKKIIISVVVSPVEIKGKFTGVVVVMRDVSAQRAVEKQRADFISTASHEMRTPVAAIEGYLSLAMNDKVSHIDSKAREFLEKAHQSTKQLGKLFQDLLTSSKAEDGRLVSHPAVIEMGDFIQSLTEGFALAAEKKHLLVDFTLDGNSQDDHPELTGKVIKPLYFVHVDPDRIQEVLTNLFDNAVKYTPTGKIVIGITADNEMVHVFVQDSGVGIPADDIPHLFQKFYRVDSSAVRTIGGTGLGLYICKKIVELYNGKIWVESVVDRGTTFHVDLPRLNTQQAQALKIAEQARDQITMPNSSLS